MSDSASVTLSMDARSRPRPDQPAPQPRLVVLFECSRPLALSARCSLAGVHTVRFGRGADRSIDRRDGELTIRVPDRWMSSSHARLESSFGRWVLEDTDSKNGTIVNGEAARRAVLQSGDRFELGHTFFLFELVAPGEGEPADDDLALRPPAAFGLHTLVPTLAAQLARLGQVAASPIPVLVAGETGTGKEVIARAIHALSGRKGEFVAVNCGAIPANLVESELFGHRKGAFSGAIEDRPGLIRAADRGTLFLDEIGDLPAGSQAALLRVLQEREVMPVGGVSPTRVDLRVVAATHRDIDAMVTAERFRRDLFARLAGFRLTAPPLRERGQDLGILVGTLVGRLAGAAEHPGFECEAFRRMLAYPWPLNIRELEQCVQTASVLAGASPVRVDHLPEEVRRGAAAAELSAPPPLEADQAAIRDQLVAMLGQHRGNISAVARDMGKDRKQIQRWLKRFGLDPESFR